MRTIGDNRGCPCLAQYFTGCISAGPDRYSADVHSGVLTMTRFAAASLAGVLVAALGGGWVGSPNAIAASAIEEGKRIAFDRRKGNCMACHLIAGANLTGNSGPPLLAMQARFPDRAKLRAQIWDATKFNPKSIMPPFGRHEILTEDEVDRVVEFIHSL